ncbi:hypothetical protein C1646_775588 [Rhizophagus diaphanus]|nr:hypothetical protein C1646_775588 [Rhizophagus diaphanus] [Rhizophagus sp. MUCL 43196]
MSSQQNKICKGCHVLRNYEEFLNEKGVALKNYSDITKTVYNSLISLENVNEFYEGENGELNLTFNIELSSFYVTILEDNESNKENIEYAKHPNLNKQRDTPAYLERYHCEGTINIEIFSNLGLISVEYSHKILHSRLRHVKATLEIKNFIQNNLNCSVSEIFRQIQENQINGYENITVQQTYYWWSIESHKTYCCDPDPLLSAKYLLKEFNQEIILNSLNTSMPALGFLTALFYRLLHNKFDAIEIDTTYNTNNLA